MPFDNILKNKFEFMMREIPPSEFAEMPYYEFEEYMKMLSKRIEDENKQNTDSNSNQNNFKMPDMSKYTPSRMPSFRK